MEQTLANLALGFSIVLQPDVLIYALLGCFIGTVVGVLPGVGPLGGIALLLPITYGLDATKAVIMLAGIYYGSQYGGSTTSILMRIPGEASSVMTCVDGYAMARKGRAGPALFIAAVGSFIAGTFGIVLLTLIAPPLAEFAVRFGPPEYVAMLVLGMMILAYMSSDSMAKVLAMALIGLLFGMVGIDPMTGAYRYDFGFTELADGISIAPVAVGLFGIGEILASSGSATPPKVIQPRMRELIPNAEEWRRSQGPIARGTLLGFAIGLIPGSAHILSSFASYALEKRLSRHPEQFGEGAIEGVAGPESANNSATSAAFIPMLSLGVPTGAVTAVLIGALAIHGVTAGPMLVAEKPQVFWGFVASMLVGNVMLLILNLPMIGLFVQLLRVPYGLLYPVIIVLCFVGVYEVNHSVLDLWIMLFFGGIGYILRKMQFDIAPIVLGLVLAPIFELTLRQSLTMSNGDYWIFVQRPVSAILLAVAGIVIVTSLIATLRNAEGWRKTLAAEE